MMLISSATPTWSELAAIVNRMSTVGWLAPAAIGPGRRVRRSSCRVQVRTGGAASEATRR
eukprot:1746397-Prymnesium_polylepis.1